jgi:hypothetical protein
MTDPQSTVLGKIASAGGYASIRRQRPARPTETSVPRRSPLPAALQLARVPIGCRCSRWARSA